jgi:hypothetical protein
MLILFHRHSQIPDRKNHATCDQKLCRRLFNPVFSAISGAAGKFPCILLDLPAYRWICGMKHILPYILMFCGLAPWTVLRAQTIEVPGDFSTIQAAIDAAQSGDIISVAPGVYTGNIQVADGIQLRGGETARTILRPGDSGATVQISNLSNIIIRNFTFADSAAGIDIANSTNVDINNNVFDVGGSGTGIVITGLGATVSIENNTFFDNETAIDGASDASTIRNNIFAANVISFRGDYYNRFF